MGPVLVYRKVVKKLFNLKVKLFDNEVDKQKRAIPIFPGEKEQPLKVAVGVIFKFRAGAPFGSYAPLLYGLMCCLGSLTAC